MKFVKTFLQRLTNPTVYAPIIAFIISVLVSSGTLEVEGDINEFIALIIQVVTSLLVIVGIANNPTDKNSL